MMRLVKRILNVDNYYRLRNTTYHMEISFDLIICDKNIYASDSFILILCK